jgi:hypothetical protein
MATNVGFASAVGYGLESTWATAVAVTASLKYLSDTMDQTRAKIVRATNRGRGARDANRATHYVAGGGLTGLLTYDLAQSWLTHFIGAFNDDVGGDYYSVLDQVVTGLTVAIDRVTSVHEFVGCVIDSVTLAGDPDSGVTFEWALTAKNRLISGQTNNAAAVAALSEPGSDVLFHECTLRVGDMGDALAAGDNLSISQFSVEINRNKATNAVNSLYQLQSKENGHRDVMLSFTIPRYEADTFLAWEAAATALQANLIMTDSTNTKDLRFSHLTVESVVINQSDDSMAEVPVVMRAHENESATNTNTGFDFEAEIQLYES